MGIKIVVFGLSISSSWGNGHATLWRGLCRALASHGHQVIFFERDVPYYAAHRDLVELPGATLHLYPDWKDVLPLAKLELSRADAGMVTSYCPGQAALFVCLTDGSPRDLQDARTAGFRTREEYAEARRRESESVLIDYFEVAPVLLPNPGYRQEASHNLVGIVRELLAAFREFHPNLILTHPYEGGHPDHDSAAFAASAAAAILRQLGGEISVCEFTSYNAGPQGDGWRTDFLPDQNSPVVRIELSGDEQALKRRMLKCYVSQKWILDAFPANVECFRPAPAYDFARAPHVGRLFYERFEWGLTGSDWRTLAEKARADLGIR